jgi:ribosomal protein S18 acetylase RimI-like enzyme
VEAARPATSADLDTLVSLAQALRAELRDVRGGALWETREAHAEPLADVLRVLLDRDSALVVVGTIDESIVGYGIAELELLRDGTWLGVITELYVEPGARAVGVGEAIAGRLVSFCSEAGCAGIDATALPGQREAKNFFERSGFTARALIMHHKLPPAPG